MVRLSSSADPEPHAIDSIYDVAKQPPTKKAKTAKAADGAGGPCEGLTCADYSEKACYEMALAVDMVYMIHHLPLL